MTVRIIDNEPDVSVTKDELRRYQADHQRDYMFYAGTPPSLETYIRRRKQDENKLSSTVFGQRGQ